MFRKIIFTLMLLAAYGVTHAEETDALTPSGILGWKGKADFGYSASSGNSNGSRLRASGEARRDWRDWALQLEAAARQAQSNNVRNEEKYNFGVQANRKLSEIDYIFGDFDREVDNFSGFDYQSTQTAGYGRQLYKEGPHTLNAQAGAGFRRSRTETDKTYTDFILKPEADYTYNFNENVDFTQNAKATLGTDFSVMETESGLKSKLAENLYAKATYTIRHTTNVPVTRKNTDTFTALSLGYTF
jgi:putative salt-induced outer membrane protein